MSNTHGENLGSLLGDWEYLFPDTTPKAAQILRVTAVDAPNKVAKFGFYTVGTFDPIKKLSLDKKILTITTVNGSKFPADISGISNQLTKVTEVGKDIIFTLQDKTEVKFTPTKFAPELKADKTTKIVGDIETLKVTNPTLKDDITLTPITNVKNGLLQLDNLGNLPADIIKALKDTQEFLSLPTATFNAKPGITPPGDDGDMLLIGIPGTLNVVPIGATAATATPLGKGAIIKMVASAWHVISEGLTTTYPAKNVAIKAIDTPSLGSDVETVIESLFKKTVHTDRKIISADVKELTVNGVVEHVIDKDIELKIITNTGNALLKLDAGGLIPISRLPKSAFEFHGVVDATKDIPKLRPDGNKWRAGDTLEVTKGSGTGNAFFQFVPVGEVLPKSGKLAVGDIIVLDSAFNWIVSSNSGSVNSAIVVTNAGVIGLTNLLSGQPTLNTLNDVFKVINDNAVWATGTQTVKGDKTFEDSTTVAALTVGTGGRDYTLPTHRSLTPGQALVLKAHGVVEWDSVSAKHVSFDNRGTPVISKDNVQEVIEEISGSSLQLTPAAADQTLHKSAGGFKTLLAGSGVIMGDGATTNQMGKMVFDAGTF